MSRADVQPPRTEAHASAAARGAAITLAGQWIRVGVQLASFVVLSRLLPPSDFGLLAMVLVISGAAGIVGDFGLSNASVQAREITDTQRNNIFWINVTIGLSLSLLIFALARPIAAFYGANQLTAITQVMSLVFLLNAATLQFRAEAMRRLRFGALAVSDIAGQVAGLGLALGFVLLGGGVWSLVAQQVGVAATPLIVLALATHWRPGLPGRAPMRSLMSFGSNVLGVQLINYASGNIDTMLVGKFWGATAVGLYSRAFQLLMLPLQQVVAPMTRVALPILSRVTDEATFERYFLRAQLATSYTVLGVLAAFAGLAYPGIEIALGPNWDATKLILLVLLAGGAFEVLTYPYSWAYLAKAHTSLLLRLTLIMRPIMIVLIGVGAVWGPVTTAVGVAVGYILNWTTHTVVALPRLRISRRRVLAVTMRPLALYAAILALAAPLAWLRGTWDRPWLQAMLTAGVIAVAFALALLCVPATRRDVKTLLDTAKRMRRPRS